MIDRGSDRQEERRTCDRFANAAEGDASDRPDARCILACETLKPELTCVMDAVGVDLPVFWTHSGKHVFPDQLRESVMETLTQIPDAYDTVLFAFGFCGNAMVGVKSDRHRLVLPKAADCIPLFLGSQADRNRYGTRTYFFTEGYLRSSSSMAGDYDELVEKYGEENARVALREMTKHYENLSVIDTGSGDPATLVEALQPLSERTGVPVSVIPGNLRLIRMLVEGDWPERDFFIKAAGEEITLEDALSFQAVSQIK